MVQKKAIWLNGKIAFGNVSILEDWCKSAGLPNGTELVLTLDVKQSRIPQANLYHKWKETLANNEPFLCEYPAMHEWLKKNCNKGQSTKGMSKERWIELLDQVKLIADKFGIYLEHQNDYNTL